LACSVDGGVSGLAVDVSGGVGEDEDIVEADTAIGRVDVNDIC
jgi:hypothetical protein